jgi:putative flippase GtrA
MKRLIRFSLVGAAGFAVDAIVLVALAPLFGPYIGRLLSFLCAVLTTWLLNRQFTFADRSRPQRMHAGVGLYLLSMAAGGLVNLGVYTILVRAFALSDMLLPLAVAAGSVAGLAVNFTLAGRYIYPARGAGDDEGERAGLRTDALPGMLLIQMLAFLVALVTLNAAQLLIVRVDIRPVAEGSLEVFSAASGQAFSSSRRMARPMESPGVMQTYPLGRRGYLPVQRIRIDPGQSSGEIPLNALSVETRWGENRYRGEALAEVITATHDIADITVSDDRVILHATGGDPYLILDPKVLAKPPPTMLIGLPLLAAVAAGLTWLLLLPVCSGQQSRRRALNGLAVIIMIAGLTTDAGRNISDRGFPGDAGQNHAISMNLLETGVYAHERRDGAPIPSNRREPVPPIMGAVWVKLLEGAGIINSSDEIHAPGGNRLFKLGNLAWVFVGLMALFLLTKTLSRSALAGWLAVIGSWYFFYAYPPRVNTFYTELHGGALLTLSVYALVQAWRRPTWLRLILAGTSLGLLMLTKAVFLYVVVFFALLFPLWQFGRQLRNPDQREMGSTLRFSIIPLLVAMVFVIPWVARGYVIFDRIEMTSEGKAHVLYTRALMNTMDGEEHKGMINLYGPHTIGDWVEGTSLERHPEDMNRGGRWQRLNNTRASDFSADDWAARRAGRPEDAISFHQKAAAEMIRQRNLYRQKNIAYPDLHAADAVADKAIDLFRQQPIDHLITSAFVMWKGFWTFPAQPGEILRWGHAMLFSDIVNLLAGGLFVIASLFAFLTGRPKLFIATGIPFGMMLFYALFSQGVPRYTTPLHPVMISTSVVVMANCWRRMKNERLDNR